MGPRSPRRKGTGGGEALSFVSLREAAAKANAAPRANTGTQTNGMPGPPLRLWRPSLAVVGFVALAATAVLIAPSGRSSLGLAARPVSIPATTPLPAGTPGGTPSRPAAADAAGGPLDPARFGPSACVALLPTAGDRHQTVFLDAGHGGPDPGALGVTQGGVGVDEARLTLPTAVDAARLLQGRGYRVVLSRTGNAAVAIPGPGDLSSGVYTVEGALKDWTARAACANAAHAAVLVSIHFNAAASPENGGMLTAYDDVRPFAADNRRLASLLHAQILGSMNAKGWGIPDAGVTTDGSAGAPALDAAGRAYGRLVILGPAAPGYLATPSEMPGAVVEPLFLTDPFEASIAAGADGQQAIAAGVAQAVGTFLGAGG